MSDPIKIEGISLQEIERALTGQETEEPTVQQSKASVLPSEPLLEDELAKLGGDSSELHE